MTFPSDLIADMMVDLNVLERFWRVIPARRRKMISRKIRRFTCELVRDQAAIFKPKRPKRGDKIANN